MRISVVVPNWNGQDLLAECLQSLEGQTAKPHIIVVDNGSGDDSIELVKTRFPKVELIALTENTGFTGGVNVGIHRAIERGDEFVALFNNDAVAEPNWLEELLKAAQKHEKAGIITCKFMRMDKKHIDSAGDFYSTWGMPFPRGRNEPDTGQYDKSRYVFGATGGASLYKTAVLKKIGIFDDHFFAYFEDVDISFRAQLLGWKVRYQPSAVAYHHIGKTSSKLGSFARYHSVKNILLLYTKNMPAWLFWRYLPLFWLQMARMALGALRDRQIGTYCRGFLAGCWLSLTGLGQRFWIQHNRVLSSKEVRRLLHHGRPPKVEKL